jgi:hypothetical protein
MSDIQEAPGTPVLASERLFIGERDWATLLAVRGHRWWASVVARSDSAPRELAAVVPVIVEIGLPVLVSGFLAASAGDGRGCGRLDDEGERIVAEAGQVVGGVPHDAAGPGQTGPVSRRNVRPGVSIRGG